MLELSASTEAEQPARNQVLQLVLPWPPSVNTYWRSIVLKGRKNATVLISERGRDYRYQVGQMCLQQSIVQWAKDNLGKPLSLHMACYPPDARKRDLDNLPKGLLDSLKEAHVFRDDSDIWDLRITRACVSQPPGRVVVRLQLFDLGAAP